MVRGMHIRTVLRKMYLLTRPNPVNPLLTAVRDTRPDPTEAEMDRYTRYHNSNQHGR